MKINSKKAVSYFQRKLLCVDMLETETYTSSLSHEFEVFPETILNISEDQPSSVRLTSYAVLNTKDGENVRLCKSVFHIFVNS